MTMTSPIMIPFFKDKELLSTVPSHIVTTEKAKRFRVLLTNFGCSVSSTLL
jgi:hypothetical protein